MTLGIISIILGVIFWYQGYSQVSFIKEYHLENSTISTAVMEPENYYMIAAVLVIIGIILVIKNSKGGIQMKKYLKTMVLAICAVFAFILTVKMGGYNVYAKDIIVPTYIDANGSTANANTYQFQKPAGVSKISIPVQISNAGRVELEVTSGGSLNTVEAYLSDDPNFQNWYHSEWFSGADIPTSGQTDKIISEYAKGPCTWYLYLIAQKEDVNQNLVFTVKAYQRGLAAGVTAGSGDLKKGEWSSFCLDKGEIGYYKIKVPSSGCINFEITEFQSQKRELYIKPDISLLNSKKKSICGVYTEKKNFLWVKKGTYYIKIEYSSSNDKEEVFKMRYTFKKAKKKKIAKNTKAARSIILKKNKKSEAMVLAGKSDGLWYEFKLTSDQTVRLNFSAKNDEAASALVGSMDENKKPKKFKIKKGTTSKKLKLKKGNYLICLFPSEHGGIYSIQWK